MKRLKILILAFCLAVSLPLAYVVWQSYQSLEQEEQAQLRFFSEALFDEMEKSMGDLVQREENRAVDEYHSPMGQDQREFPTSSLSRRPDEKYILGYLQNNPDGSFQTPLVADMGRVPQDMRDLVLQLKQTNNAFNKKRLTLPTKPASSTADLLEIPKTEELKTKKAGFADRYISKQQVQDKKSYLGRKSVRKEKISPRQALNFYKEDRQFLKSSKDWERAESSPATGGLASRPASDTSIFKEELDNNPSPITRPSPPGEETSAFQVEVAPLQSVFISSGRFFIFRRIAINNQIYRQGFVLEVQPFLRHLTNAHFDSQPMARFTGLSMQVAENGAMRELVQSGIETTGVEPITRRTFPAPFDFLSANLTAASAPPSPARRTLGIALWVLGLFMLAGLVAIYQSTRTVVDLSERRSQFVSSVTHELKTPLTNIRMYIEMLEQGIAATPEREQDYLQILGSESSRLSRLINNVLELAKLEKKQRFFDMREGQLEDVLNEVRTVMAHKLTHEGFELKIESSELPAFDYDREVLIQVLINLIENSIKFGGKAPDKVITISTKTLDGRVFLSVSDTGPGIPRRALKKVFDDFYRVENELTRTTGGTGIGLALVKKFIVAMGGRVEATNNTGAGCTITMTLPLKT